MKLKLSNANFLALIDLRFLDLIQLRLPNILLFCYQFNENNGFVPKSSTQINYIAL